MLISLFFRYLFLVIDSCAYSCLFVPVLSLYCRFGHRCDDTSVAFVVALVGVTTDLHPQQRAICSLAPLATPFGLRLRCTYQQQQQPLINNQLKAIAIRIDIYTIFSPEGYLRCRNGTPVIIVRFFKVFIGIL